MRPFVRPAYLDSLNQAQYQAVTHDPKIPLQILAGPGSGKTRVLTCRVAHLVEHYGLKPDNICAVTFTNKAANEMKSRLRKLIGEDRTLRLIMGTFHAICARLLRTFGSQISLPSNFSICDADQSKQIISDFLRLPDTLAAIQAADVQIEASLAATVISKAKAKGISAQEFSQLADALPNNNNHGAVQRIIAKVYIAYTKELKSSNCLDFDDLLVSGVELLRARPRVVNNIRHVLVDEFQDTNIMQFELMCLLASSNKCVSIVGDPDQSIYGWRSAEVENLAKMQRQFAGTQQIFLEENYRSTGAILKASLEIISRDDTRIDRLLFTSHGRGTTPTLYECDDESREATAIANEVKRLLAYGGGQLTYNDFAILLRFNALSLHIETAFRRQGIPCRILGGHRFFERVEVKDLIAYLQLVDNPDFKPAFVRAVNTPKRGLGKKSIAEIVKHAELNNTSPMRLAEAIIKGTIPDTKPSVKSKLGPFVRLIAALRDESRQGTSVADLLHTLLDIIKYQEHLKTNEGWEARWENVKQLITFATEIDEEDQHPGASTQSGDGTADSSQSDVTGPAINEGNTTTPLRRFLEASLLSTDAQSAEDEANQPSQKVTITTCHAAKGLEWPVVMVPAVEDGTFPFYRSEDIAEERRLLYVACTRAQGFLYLSHARYRTLGGDKKERGTSRFIQEARRAKDDILSFELPSLSLNELQPVFDVLGRTLPKQEDVDTRVAGLAPLSRLVGVPTFPEFGEFSTFPQQDPSSRSKQVPPYVATRPKPPWPTPPEHTTPSPANHRPVTYAAQFAANHVTSNSVGRGFSSASASRLVVAPTPPVNVVSSASQRQYGNVQNRPATSMSQNTHPITPPQPQRNIIWQPTTSKPSPAFARAAVSQSHPLGSSAPGPSAQVLQHALPQPQPVSRRELEARENIVAPSDPVVKPLPPVTTTSNKRLGMRGPLKPYGAPKPKRARADSNTPC